MQTEFEIHYEDIYSGPFLLSDLVLLYLERQLPSRTLLFVEDKGAWIHMMDYMPFQRAVISRQNQIAVAATL